MRGTMESMVRRRGILGGIAVVGAGVAVFFTVSRSGRERETVSGDPGQPHQEGITDSAHAPDSSVRTEPTVSASVLEHGWTLRGRLLRYPDPEALEPTIPAEGALIRLSLREDAEEPKLEFAPREARSGSDGRFELIGVPGKAEYRLLVDAEGCALRAVGFELPDLEEPGTKELPDIVLEEPERLAVIIEAPDGRATECERVTAVLGSEHEKGTDAQLQVEQEPIGAKHLGGGTYVFERLSRGTHVVFADARGYGGAARDLRLPHPDVLVLRLRRGQTISGTVRSTNGAPIPAATVESGSTRVRADEQGRFTLEDLPCSADEPCRIAASAEGFRYLEQAVSFPDVEFVLVREAVLSGRVLAAATGRPLGGATLSDNRMEAGATDPHGAFVLELEPGSHEIWVDHQEHVRLDAGTWELEEGERVDGLELKLTPGLSVRGRVLSATTRAPVPGTAVTVWWGSETRYAASDESGSFEVRGLTEDEHPVRVLAEGFAETAAQARVPPVTPEEWTFLLEEEGMIHGRVFDAEGEPVARALVFAGYQGEHEPEAFQKTWKTSAWTDSRGTYRFSGVPAHDDYRLLAVLAEEIALGWSEAISVAPGERKEVDLLFRGSCAIRGRARTPAGAGIPGALVTLSLRHDGCFVVPPYPKDLRFDGLVNLFERKTVVAGASGEFEFPHLCPANYSLVVSTEDRDGANRTVKLEDGSAPFLDIVLEDGTTTSGSVVDRSGRPVPGALVRFSGYGWMSQVEADNEGLFEARKLETGRAWVEAAGFGLRSPRIGCDIPSGGIVLEVEPEAVISGKVVARGMKTLPLCGVRFDRLRGGRREQVFDGWADVASRFAASVPPGRYLLHAEADGLVCAGLQLEVSAGERRDVVLELVPGGSVQVKLGVEGREPARAWFFLESPSSPPLAEEFEHFPDEVSFEAVAPGPATLLAVAQDYGMVRRSLVIEAAKVTEVSLMLPRLRGIFGQVTRRGEPVGAASVLALGPGGQHACRTAPDGWYEIGGLDPGTYEILAEGSAKGSAVLTRDRAVQKNIEIAATVVSGTVILGDEPRAGVPVEAMDLSQDSRGETKTDATGWWSLELSAPDEYIVVFGEGAASRGLALEDGQTTATIDIEIEKLPKPEPDEPEKPQEED